MTHYEVSIYHNNRFRDAVCDGYQIDHTITHVLTYTTRDGDRADPLEHAFELFNVGHEPEFTGGRPDDRAMRYRLARNRSLSVGDVVALRAYDERGGAYGEPSFHAVASVGFVPIPAPVVWEAPWRPGSVPAGVEQETAS